MKVYLSHGGGVNSWALYLYLMEQGEKPGVDFEAVFVDHGTDWPETYEYMDMMIARGYPVTVIKPEVQGHYRVDEYYIWKNTIPYRKTRDCTEKFKIKALLNYQQKPCVCYIGIDAGEAHRAKMYEDKGVTYDYPLVTAGIDRKGCEDIIKRHGLPLPPKSGCYICPFQSRAQWIELRKRHPELFCNAKKLEELTNQRRAEAGKEPVYFCDIPPDVLIQPKDNRGHRGKAWQGTLDLAEDDMPPCRCGL